MGRTGALGAKRGAGAIGPRALGPRGGLEVGKDIHLFVWMFVGSFVRLDGRTEILLFHRITSPASPLPKNNERGRFMALEPEQTNFHTLVNDSKLNKLTYRTGKTDLQTFI